MIYYYSSRKQLISSDSIIRKRENKSLKKVLTSETVFDIVRELDKIEPRQLNNVRNFELET